MQKTTLVKRKLMGYVKSGTPGDQLPTETDLCQKFNVSKITIRRAMQQLVDYGYLYRIRGSGTFIKTSDPDKTQIQAFSFNDLLTTPVSTQEIKETEHLRFAIPDSGTIHILYEELTKEFQDKNKSTNISIERHKLHKNLPYYFYDIEKGIVPDLLETNLNQLFCLVCNKNINPVEIPDREFPFNTINPHIKKSIFWYNKLWMIPRNMHIGYLVYNKTLFDKAGIPYPDDSWTWQTLTEVAKELTIPEIGQYGTIPFRDLYYLSLISWAYGADFFDCNGKVFIDKKSTFDTIQYVVDMVFKHKITMPVEKWHWGYNSAMKPVQRKMFMAGKIAILPSICSDMPLALNQVENLDWNFALLPSGPCGRFTPVTFSGLTIGANTNHPAPCNEFMKFAASPDSAKKFAGHDLTPYNQSSLLDAYFSQFKDKNTFNLLLMRDYIRQFPCNGKFCPFLGKHIFEMFESIYLKKESLKTAAKRTAKLVQIDLDRFLKLDEHLSR
jgi:multiple sugar transport system substrate-binding protein